MRAAIVLFLAVLVILAGCAGSQVSEGPSTEEVARNLAQQVVPAIPDGASVLILGFYESGNGALHAANDALTADLTIEFLNAPDRDIRIINRDMLNQALGSSSSACPTSPIPRKPGASEDSSPRTCS